MLHTDPQITQSEYQRSLDEGIPDPQTLSTQTVRYWSDFNRVFYHPRSIVQINDYELNSSLMPFEKWENGEELFMSMDTDNDLLDRDVRVWAEECDQMQGLQIFTGGDDAWGGFASRYVEKLRDEYGKMPIWTWGIEEEQGRGQMAKQLLRTINAARTINEMARNASLYVPMSVPATQLPQYVHLNRDSQWHISALLSTVVESMTLPTRLRPDKQRRGLLGDIEVALNVNCNQRIAQLQCTILDPDTELPRPANGYGSHDDRAPSNTVHATAGEGDGDMITLHLDMNLSTGNRVSSSYASQHDTSDHIFGAVENMRGKRQEAGDQELNEDEITYARKRRRLAGWSVVERFVARQSFTISEIAGYTTRKNAHCCRYQSSLAFPLLDSFPRIFSLRPDLAKAAVHSSLSTTTDISTRVKTLQKLVSRMVGLDERETLSNGLGEIREAYEEGWNSGSDEDSDD